MDANYYHYPGSWIGAKPGFMNGGGFPMRFADTDGTLIDVYQENTNMTDEATSGATRRRSTHCSTTRSVRSATTARSASTCTPTTPRPSAGDEAIVASAQARRRAGDLVQAAADLGRRPQHLDDPQPRLERRHTHVHHVGRGGRERAPDDAAAFRGRPGRSRPITAAGSAVPYTVQTIKGIQYAVFDASSGPLHRDVLVGEPL